MEGYVSVYFSVVPLKEAALLNSMDEDKRVDVAILTALQRFFGTFTENYLCQSGI